MADITLKLIWYKLGETRSNMADRYGRFLEWYRTFDIRRVDIVDMFFVGWIVFACVVVGTLQLYLKIFAGKPKNSQDSRRQQRAGGSSPSSSGVASRPGIHYATESCQWLNSAINWIYLNYSTTPGFIQNWLAALNDEAKKSQSSLSVRFDRILAGSLPPRVTNVHTEVASKETFVIHGIIDSSELAFQVLVSQETPTKVELTNCDVNVKLLRGPLKSEVRLAQDEVHVFVKFEGAPEVVLVVKPHSVKGQQPINTQQVEDMIRRYITASVTHFQLSTQAIAGLPGMPSIVRESMTAMQNHVPDHPSSSTPFHSDLSAPANNVSSSVAGPPPGDADDFERDDFVSTTTSARNHTHQSVHVTEQPSPSKLKTNGSIMSSNRAERSDRSFGNRRADAATYGGAKPPSAGVAIAPLFTEEPIMNACITGSYGSLAVAPPRDYDQHHPVSLISVEEIVVDSKNKRDDSVDDVEGVRVVDRNRGDDFPAFAADDDNLNKKSGVPGIVIVDSNATTPMSYDANAPDNDNFSHDLPGDENAPAVVRDRASENSTAPARVENFASVGQFVQVQVKGESARRGPVRENGDDFSPRRADVENSTPDPDAGSFDGSSSPIPLTSSRRAPSSEINKIQISDPSQTQKPDVLELFENQSFIEITPSKRDVPEKTPRHLKTQQILPAGQSRTLRVSDVFNRQDKRLLVKILKASGLGSKDFGCSEPYCMVEMDDPVQKHSTSVVKNTVNPFWDEHFLFDLNSHSKELIFEVFDREKPPGDDFLGMAVVSVDELCKNPSSRQIIPLAGRSPGTGKGGNITVEFLFMERADQTGIQPDERELMIGAADNLSPRRRIETNRSVMPGGLVVTTQTTTTERPQESPNRTDRVDLTSDFAKPLSSVDSSPHSSRRTVPSPTGGVPRPNDTLLTSSTSREIQQQPQTPTAPYNKSGESDKRKRASKKMTQSTPTEELKDDGRLSSTSSEQAAERQSNKPKRSSSIASTLRKRFSRQKKPRSQSADRASYHDDQHLRPPDQYGSRSTVTPSPDSDFDISSCSSAAFSNQSYLTANTTTTTKDLDNVDIPGQTSNLQKSRSIGSSLKRLFKRRKSGRKNGPEQGSRSRDSSMSRSRDRLTADAHSNQDISQASSTANPSPDPRRSHQYQPQQQQQQSNSGRMSTSSAV
ncbi:uncharacterized protein LOC141907058 isoform X4 [Tubulanus polymorphus]|uniref:uncharacterized protein LOC141907058 isoform X4 n=1 Tax=Tubulanus polymorphus TaxID=672921 RepID=UPI003DA2D896